MSSGSLGVGPCLRAELAQMRPHRSARDRVHGGVDVDVDGATSSSTVAWPRWLKRGEHGLLAGEPVRQQRLDLGPRVSRIGP